MFTDYERKDKEHLAEPFRTAFIIWSSPVILSDAMLVSRCFILVGTEATRIRTRNTSYMTNSILHAYQNILIMVRRERLCNMK